MGVSLFILSDIHAFRGSLDQSSSPSYFDITAPAGQSASNPLAALQELIKTHSITADYLICCGDLADKAVPDAIERTWREIQDLKSLLKAREVLSTVGNHDVDSRYAYNDHDARGVLLGLSPQFPFVDDAVNNHFWTHHFAIQWHDKPKLRFVMLNSSAYHGEGAIEKKEFHHGRISTRTLQRLIKALKSDDRANLNVLVCHHHPQKHDDCDLGDYDDMRGGSDLLKSLDAAEFGPWVIIHGHKHHPKIAHTQGGNSSAIVFSAGSCAAILQPQLIGHARNQVYLVKLDCPSGTTSGKGSYRSWQWAPGLPWTDSKSDAGLPGVGGFGFRGQIDALAKQVTAAVASQSTWKDLMVAVPDLAYLIPEDLTQLCKLLQQNGCSIENGENGTPILIQK
jgi:Icc-related predicted phosphoesterase